MLEGRVTHPEHVVAGIHVINADRGLAEITDIDGNFQISVTVGERLVFSGVQYKKRELIISRRNICFGSHNRLSRGIRK